MNKHNAKDYLPLVRALADGKEVQIRNFDGWKTNTDYNFSIPANYYRIKPEPKEIWVNRYPDGVESGGYPSKDDAVRGGDSEAVQVRYREVIE